MLSFRGVLKTDLLIANHAAGIILYLSCMKEPKSYFYSICFFFEVIVEAYLLYYSLPNVCIIYCGVSFHGCKQQLQQYNDISFRWSSMHTHLLHHMHSSSSIWTTYNQEVDHNLASLIF